MGAPGAYIIDGLRSPFGRRNGQLAAIRSDELAAHVFSALVARVGLSPEAIEDVRLGVSTQTGEQGLNLGRLVPLIAGWPVEVPGATVNRMCGSSLEAINQAAEAIMAGTHDIVLAGGVESMSRVPMLSDGAPLSASLTARYDLVPHLKRSPCRTSRAAAAIPGHRQQFTIELFDLGMFPRQNGRGWVDCRESRARRENGFT